MSDEAIIGALQEPEFRLSRSGFVADKTVVPKQPGIYAWWVGGLEHLTTGHDLIERDGLALLYVGICPSKSSRSRTGHLRHRLIRHFGVDAPGIQGSTLRFSLAVCLGMPVYRVRGGRKTLGKSGERRLNAWMDSHAFVSWMVTEAPWAVEDEVIASLGERLLLNLRDNHRNPEKARLEAMRAAALRNAPVINSPGDA